MDKISHALRSLTLFSSASSKSCFIYIEKLNEFEKTKKEKPRNNRDFAVI